MSQPDLAYIPQPNSAGWTCAWCGTFVVAGQSHICPKWPVAQTIPVNYLNGAEISQKLDRIVDLLEALVHPKIAEP